VKAALELVRLTGENPARYQVRSIDVSKGYCMIVSDERHAKITFPLGDIAAQLDRLALLFANVDLSKREIQTVNLLVERNVPVTFVPPPEPMVDGTGGAVEDGTDAISIKKPLVPVNTQKTTVKRAQALHKTTTSGHHIHATTVRRAVAVFPTAGTQP
jgi:hypothetical protein